jgi:hypothetical protein
MIKAATVTMKKEGSMPKRSTVIRGVIIPAGWDEEGNIIAVAISAQDEIEYQVEMAAKGQELMRLVNKEVTVSGEVAEKENKKSITVSNYNLMGRQ